MKKTIHDKLRAKIYALPETNPNTIEGTNQTIRVCFDDVAHEYLNVGVAFTHPGGTLVHIIKDTSRLVDLFWGRLTADTAATAFESLRFLIEKYGPEADRGFDCGFHHKLGEKLYAQGQHPAEIARSQFMSVTELCRGPLDELPVDASENAPQGKSQHDNQ